jgi:hypothetical protein
MAHVFSALRVLIAVLHGLAWGRSTLGTACCWLPHMPAPRTAYTFFSTFTTLSLVTFLMLSPFSFL